MSLLGVGKDADPTVVDSVANKLGLGGYHLITNVKSSIGPGKFTTSVDALFHYSGDRRAFKLINGQGEQQSTSEETPSIESNSNLVPMSDSCNAVYSTIIQNANEIVNGKTDKYESIGDVQTVISSFPPKEEP